MTLDLEVNEVEVEVKVLTSLASVAEITGSISPSLHRRHTDLLES